MVGCWVGGYIYYWSESKGISPHLTCSSDLFLRNTDTHIYMSTHLYEYTHIYLTLMSTSERLSQLDLEIHEVGR
jgi:hypothetical protein